MQKINFITPIVLDTKLHAQIEYLTLYLKAGVKFLLLVSSTLEGWRTESTLEPPSDFEEETPNH